MIKKKYTFFFVNTYKNASNSLLLVRVPSLHLYFSAFSVNLRRWEISYSIIPVFELYKPFRALFLFIDIFYSTLCAIYIGSSIVLCTYISLSLFFFCYSCVYYSLFFLVCSSLFVWLFLTQWQLFYSLAVALFLKKDLLVFFSSSLLQTLCICITFSICLSQSKEKKKVIYVALDRYI